MAKDAWRGYELCVVDVRIVCLGARQWCWWVGAFVGVDAVLELGAPGVDPRGVRSFPAEVHLRGLAARSLGAHPRGRWAQAPLLLRAKGETAKVNQLLGLDKQVLFASISFSNDATTSSRNVIQANLSVTWFILFAYVVNLESPYLAFIIMFCWMFVNLK